MSAPTREYQHAGKDELTPRQKQILVLIAEGDQDWRIAQKIFVHESTVKKHVRDMLSKMRARGRANLIHIAYQKGLLGGFALALVGKEDEDRADPREGSRAPAGVG